MLLEMIGIDYTKASITEREIFAFSNNKLLEVMQIITKTAHVSGCVMISTCNRTELYVSTNEKPNIDLIEILCDIKEVSFANNKELFTKRYNLDAIHHLFETACGLHSQILGEDQILTQVKNAIEIARENGFVDKILEKLFQTAITNAKKIKTTVKVTLFDVSVITKSMEHLRSYYNDLCDKKCLVIGNGEMGRTFAEKLAQSGADVTVTLRKYKYGTSVVPGGCHFVDYENRYEAIKDSEIIVSATSSPHYTIIKKDVEYILSDKRKRLFIDLAVPRDVDPTIIDENTILFNIDSLGIHDELMINNQSIKKAQFIIEEQVEVFMQRYFLEDRLKFVNSGSI